MKEPPVLTPANASFTGTRNGPLVLRVEGEEDRIVGIRRMFPTTHPAKYLSVHDEENEIGTITDISEFSREQQKLIEEEIRHQYFVPRITEINEIKDELGYFMWDVITDRGPRTFYVKGRSENVHSHRRARSGGAFANLHTHGEYRIFVSDIEDCKYEIEDYRKLSRTSRLQLEKVI